MADLSRLYQRNGKCMEDYIRCFRKLKFKYRVVIPEIEFVKMATRGMNFELHKNVKGMEFKDLYELATIDAWYEKILLVEQEMKNSWKCTYYKNPSLEVLVIDYEVDFDEVDMTELTCKLLGVFKALHRATDGSSTLVVKKKDFKVGKNYTFDISMANQIFNALLTEKLALLNSGYKMPKAEDLKGK